MLALRSSIIRAFPLDIFNLNFPWGGVGGGGGRGGCLGSEKLVFFIVQQILPTNVLEKVIRVFPD